MSIAISDRFANPYSCRTTLPGNSKMLYGRQRELSEVEIRLAAERPQNCALVGDRRIGKSSLLHRLWWRCRYDTERWPQTIPIFMDAEEIGSIKPEKFFRFVYKEARALLDPEDASSVPETVEGFEEFRDFVADQSPKYRFIIFIDEFEVMADNKHFGNDFFISLRALGQGPQYRLAFVTCSKSTLDRLCQDKHIKSSHFWNIFSTTWVGLLDEEPANQLMTEPFNQAGVYPPVDHQERVNRLAGRHPFFIQMVCEEIFNKFSLMVPLKLSELEWKLRLSIRPHLEYLWEEQTLEEQTAIKLLHAIRLEPQKERLKSKLQDLSRDITDELLARGILTEDTTTGDLQLFSQLFNGFVQDLPLKQEPPSWMKKVGNRYASVIEEIERLVKLAGDAKKLLRA
ncbi:MAG: ATP-binding protein [bacterium]|nr:ATP-binding protein [bacterium]